DGLINNHLMTGENSTVELHTGDEVSAGAIAVSSLQLQVTAPQGERLIDNWAEAALTAGMKSSTYSKAFAKMESALVFIALCGSAGAGIVSYLRGGSVQNV